MKFAMICLVVLMVMTLAQSKQLDRIATEALVEERGNPQCLPYPGDGAEGCRKKYGQTWTFKPFRRECCPMGDMRGREIIEETEEERPPKIRITREETEEERPPKIRITREGFEKRYCGQAGTPCTSDGDCCLSLGCAIPGNRCDHIVGKRYAAEAQMDKRYCGQEDTPCTGDGDCCMGLQCAIPGNKCKHTMG